VSPEQSPEQSPELMLAVDEPVQSVGCSPIIIVSYVRNGCVFNSCQPIKQ
jgi:hypothetical protein